MSVNLEKTYNGPAIRVQVILAVRRGIKRNWHVPDPEGERALYERLGYVKG